MKPINSSEIKNGLFRTYSEITNPRNDGFSQWGLKQELYQLKFQLDELLKNCPTFVGEEEWLEEQHKKQMWSELKR